MPPAENCERVVGSADVFPGRSLDIGPWKIRPNLVMAPLAGLTDPYFRGVVRRLGGCGLIVTEMVSSEALTRGSDKALRMLRLRADESPLAVQVIGGDAGRMAQAAVMAEEAGADFVDVNMGCPVKKVVKGRAGAALMRQPARTADLLRRMRNAMTIPLTVKIRAGWNDGERSAAEMARVAEDAGAAAIAVHPRSRKQQFSGRADWSVIEEVKKAVTIPVIGNGDVRNVDDVERMERETGCDGVMIGRGALINPFIFNQIVAQRSRGHYRWLTPGEIKAIMLAQFDEIVANEPAKMAMHKMRSFTGWYSRGVPGGADLRRRINGIADTKAFLAAIRICLADEHLDLDPRPAPSYNPPKETPFRGPGSGAAGSTPLR
ncbi:MAG: tRNA dihydrouridine synthase DusB [Acidobacteriota bacterium]